MRILLVGDYPPDPRLGSAKVYFKLREEFQNLGHSVELILGDRFGVAPRNRLLRWAISPVLAARAVLRVAPSLHRWDVLDAASAEGLWLGVCRRLTRTSQPALVARSHGLEHRNFARMVEDDRVGLVRKAWYRRWYYPIVRMTQVQIAASLSDRMILLNEADRDFAIKGKWLPRDRTEVIPHGVSSRFIDTPAGRTNHDGFRFLFCGSWDAMKGVHYLAKGFELFRAQGGSAILTVVGGGHPASIIRKSFDESVHAFVHVVDRVDEDELMRIYRTHDVLLFTSTYEGFGMVVPEAMSQGLPVIGTSEGISGSLVQDHVTGRRIPSRDPVALAKAMHDLANAPDHSHHLGEAARHAVASMTWRHAAEQTIQCYEDAIRHAESRRG